MLTVTLKRISTGEHGTFGTLQVTDRDIICHTLEPPWKDNRKDISCIPAGEYVVKRHTSLSFGYELYWIQDVPDRTKVYFHIGNTLPDTKGCILVGIAIGELGGVPAVLNSKGAWERISKLFGDQDFKLIITEVGE